MSNITDLIHRLTGIMMIFLAGIIVGVVSANINLDSNIPTGHSIADAAMETITFLTPLGNAPERDSPADRIKDWDVERLSDRVIIHIDDPGWAEFNNTNSMDPVLDKGANAIQITPKNESEIQVGDIITYNNLEGDWVIHRVKIKDKDELGTYFIVKGDNNPASDEGKVRFEQIRSITVGILY